jgi:hypothetical protein
LKVKVLVSPAAKVVLGGRSTTNSAGHPNGVSSEKLMLPLNPPKDLTTI